MFTKRLTRRAGVFGATTAAALAITVGAAQADIVYNTVDATVDATVETMNLLYDATNSIAGPNGSTTLQIEIEGHNAGDHAGCNIQGGAHYVGLATGNSNPAAATVAFLNGDDTFNSCNETLTVVVTPAGVGLTHITFSVDDSKTANDPSLGFSFAQAAFDVNVADSDLSGTSTTCDADPAAPAWAAALLKGNNLKAKANTLANYVSQVAGHMGLRASFDGSEKNADGYADAVWDYMKTTLGLSLPKGPDDVAKPGWTCTTV